MQEIGEEQIGVSFWVELRCFSPYECAFLGLDVLGLENFWFGCFGLILFGLGFRRCVDDFIANGINHFHTEAV